MEKCSYKTWLLAEEWECPFDAPPMEEYCYWHKEKDGKEPTEEQLKDLKENEIFGVYLKEANLVGVNFQEANLQEANLQEADLREANLQEACLFGAKLQGAILYGTRFDSKTNLDDSVLIGANLFHSYFDETKSFRNAVVFQNADDKEINEIVVDALDWQFISFLKVIIKLPVTLILDLIFVIVTKVSKKKPRILLPILPFMLLNPFVLDMETITKKAPSAAAKLRGNGLIRYAGYGDKIIFFDKSSRCVIKNQETPRHDRSLIRVDELTDLLLKDGKIQSKFLYDGSRADIYEASYEVYNNLYNFYIANGRLDQAAHVHYRRGEVHRKLRWARGGWKNRARSIFDLVILRTLTGYGDRIGRPIFVSGLIIGLFAFLFWLSDGIVKNVNGTVMCVNDTSNDTVMYVNNTQVAPDWIDYLYHSITTFTSIGYSNIQPNLAAGHLPQVLVAAESGLGVLMMALIIFVVTYQVSR